MISRIEQHQNAMDAAEALAALSNAWATEGHADPVEETRATQRGRKQRVLDLHLVPQMKLAEAAGVFSCLNENYPFEWKQQVRQLRNQLTQFDEEVKQQRQTGLKVVGLLSVNGLRPRFGMAANLAFSLAAMEDTKVLVVDAKVRRPDMGEKLGQAEGKGLCEAIRAYREDLPECFRRVAGTQLYMLPHGQGTKYDGEALDLRGMQKLIAGLKDQFDWIIIDGPGFDTPADATLVSLCADGCLYLVEQGVDRFEDLRLALKQTQGRYMIGAVMV